MFITSWISRVAGFPPATKYAIALAMFVLHPAVMMSVRSPDASSGGNGVSEFVIAWLVMTVPGVPILVMFRRNRWHAAALVHCSYMLMSAVMGVVFSTLTCRGLAGIGRLCYEIGFAVLATATLQAIYESWTRRDKDEAARSRAELARLRAVGGACPRCGGRGVKPPDALTRVAAAFGGAFASSRGAPMSSGHAVDEFTTRCDVCGGTGHVGPDAAPS